MNDKISVISYMFATIASVCFISGLVVLSGEGRGQSDEPSRSHVIHT